MRKRLMIGLASGALLAAMMPGVAAAAGPINTGICVNAGALDRAADPSIGRGPAVSLPGGNKGPSDHSDVFTTWIVCGFVTPA